MSILDDIVCRKREDLLHSKRHVDVGYLESLISHSNSPRDLAAAIASAPGGHNKIIAEIKKASPSKGIIRDNFDPPAIAMLYQENGAVAISVLTDTPFFQGRLEHLAAAAKVVTIPVLRKDFIIDSYQLYEARAHGADAVLLIAAILSDQELDFFLGICDALSLSALVEVHNHEELKRALSFEARIVGINNRDLNTFKTDIATTLQLIADIPNDVTVISESGLSSPEEIGILRAAGVDAFLIGEALMKSSNPGNTLRALVG